MKPAFAVLFPLALILALAMQTNVSHAPVAAQGVAVARLLPP